MDEHMNAMAREMAEQSTYEAVERLAKAITASREGPPRETLRLEIELQTFATFDRVALRACRESKLMPAIAASQSAAALHKMGSRLGKQQLLSLRDDYVINSMLAHISTYAMLDRNSGTYVPAVPQPANGDAALAEIARLGAHSQPLYDALLEELTASRAAVGGSGPRPLREWYEKRPHLLGRPADNPNPEQPELPLRPTDVSIRRHKRFDWSFGLGNGKNGGGDA